MKNILFVEDEDRGVYPYFDSLERRGYHCTLASDGDQALQFLKQNHYDLISLDVMFEPGEELAQKTEPQKAGLFLLQMIRDGKIANCNSDMRVVVLTAIVNAEVEQQIKQLGISAYLRKPVEFRKVVDILNEVMA